MKDYKTKVSKFLTISHIRNIELLWHSVDVLSSDMLNWCGKQTSWHKYDTNNLDYFVYGWHWYALLTARLKRIYSQRNLIIICRWTESLGKVLRFSTFVTNVNCPLIFRLMWYGVCNQCTTVTKPPWTLEASKRPFRFWTMILQMILKYFGASEHFIAFGTFESAWLYVPGHM